MYMHNNFGIERYVYSNTQKGDSANGLYILLAGETLPCPHYRLFAPSGLGEAFKGGVYVLEYVIEGIEYIESEKACFTAGAGYFCFLNKNWRRTCYSDVKSPCRKLWIHVSGPFMDGLTSALGLKDEVFIKYFPAQHYFEKIHSLLSGITFTERQSVFNKTACLITEMLLEAAAGKDNAKRSIVQEIKLFIDSGINLKASLGDICSRFYINKSYFVQVFKAAYGITPHRYLLNKRIETAKALLSYTMMPIHEIAINVGFENAQYFSTVFRQAEQCTPKEYRNSRQ